MIFAGFDDWFEVFRAGTHTDSAGNTRTWTEADLKQIASSYDPARHEAPIVIGHPAIDAPAFGWCERLKVEGGVLYARVRDVVTEFADMVRRGLFKKRSIALYPDMTLRHIGFLGAMPPAVKGLKDISFQDNDGAVTIEFGESWAWNSIAGAFRRLREYFIEREGVEKADALLPEYTIEDIKSAATPAQEAELYAEKEEKGMKEPGKESPPQTFSEADVERIRNEARAEGKKEAEATFAETQRQDSVKKKVESAEAWMKSKVELGALSPATIKAGMKQFMEFLCGAAPEFQFGENKDPLEWFKEFVDKRVPKEIELSEIATRDNEFVGQDAAGKKLTVLLQRKMEKNPSMNYDTAFTEVQRENPELAREYQAELGGK